MTSREPMTVCGGRSYLQAPPDGSHWKTAQLDQKLTDWQESHMPSKGHFRSILYNHNQITQGTSLSPTLFNVFIKDMYEEWDRGKNPLIAVQRACGRMLTTKTDLGDAEGTIFSRQKDHIVQKEFKINRHPIPYNFLPKLQGIAKST